MISHHNTSNIRFILSTKQYFEILAQVWQPFRCFRLPIGLIARGLPIGQNSRRLLNINTYYSIVKTAIC